MTAKRIPTTIDHKPFQEYFKEIRSRYLTRDFTEITLRTPLENFIKSLSKDFNLIQEPKRTERIGAPDFKAYRKNVKIGYIETKDLGKNLDEELKSEQIKRYRSSLDNLILTDYGRFILTRGKQIPFDFNLFNLSDLDNSRFVIPDEKIQEFLRLLEIFLSYNLPTIKSAEELSLELSKRAKLLKELAKEQLEEDISRVKNNESTSSVYDFYEGTKELIKDISIDDCADAYAQTITYGLFLAKMNCPSILDRNTAASYIPRSIGVIKRIFVNISGDSLPSNLSWIIDEIIDVLNASEMKDVLTEIDARGKKDRDPFTFFYEDFLSAYDPEKKKHLGVYYTPRPVVSFIVNSINYVLKNDFNKLHGFADDDVTVLDPAVGTGTFLWLIYTLTLVELKNKGLGGLISRKIENHILRHFYGLEILITPYIIAHLKLSLALKKWFYELKDNDRNQVYLANTLEPSESHGLMPFMKEITEESKVANRLKQVEPILVVTGNPPYSVSSSNKSEWIMEKMKDYKKDLDEKNIQPLDDDYIKFMRFAQWKIERNNQGIIGFITNNSYLDGIIHRQMRKELLSSFDRIYILNLHGDSRKKETSPDGSKDENVFDIQQGVAIGLFIKNAEFEGKKIFYADLYGTREEKYLWLDRNKVNTVKWQELKPEEPYYFFKPQKDIQNYKGYVSLKEIFKDYNAGVVTGRDNILTDLNEADLTARIKDIFSSSDISAYEKELNNSAGRKILAHRTKLKFNQEKVKKYHYRPFDIRYVYYCPEIMERPRVGIISHLFHENIAVVVSRINTRQDFDSVIVTQNIPDYKLGESTRGSYVFPLYLYDYQGASKDASTCTDAELKFKKQANFTIEFVRLLEMHYPKRKITPEEILAYIYAVLHSSIYRERYRQFLKIDFPRIPFAKEYDMFKIVSELGKELISLHLMKTKLASSIKFDVQGSNVVEFVKYTDGKVYINKNQIFAGVPEKAWNFYIGGYQVLDKWLKSRKKRELSGSEIEQFIQITEIINQTLDLMKKIDEIKFL